MTYLPYLFAVLFIGACPEEQEEIYIDVMMTTCEDNDCSVACKTEHKLYSLSEAECDSTNGQIGRSYDCGNDQLSLTEYWSPTCEGTPSHTYVSGQCYSMERGSYSYECGLLTSTRNINISHHNHRGVIIATFVIFVMMGIAIILFSFYKHQCMPARQEQKGLLHPSSHVYY